MPSITETRQEVVHLVLPEHANIQGKLFGGRMMYWIVSAATLAALRLARGPVVLGSMDSLDFLSPVHVGDLVSLRAQIEHVGRASMEVGVEVMAEEPRTRARRPATASHLAMVAVDENGIPRPVGATIAPGDQAEEALAHAAQVRKHTRDRRLADRRSHAEQVGGEEEGLRHSIAVPRLVFPEDAVAGSIMFAGTLLLQLDEYASILAFRYARGPVVTASLDTLDFYAPIRVGNIVTYQAALNAVWRTSMEVGVKVVAEDPRSDAMRHTCTAYLTSVHLGPDRRPAPLPPFVPVTEAERRRAAEAGERRALREQRRAAMRMGGPV